VALAAHERRLRSEGAAVPPLFADLIDMFRELVRARHDATTLYVAVSRSHDVDVAERLLLTKSEAAERLGVSVRTVERLVAAGRLPQVLVEGARRIRVADLMAYVEGLAGSSSTADAAEPSTPNRRAITPAQRRDEREVDEESGR
jgi:excisionase family DNA binding protein